MRKAIIVLTTSLSLVIIASQFNVWDSLLMFLLVGTIPGTSLSLSPAVMLLSMAILVGIGIMLLMSQSDTSIEQAEKTLPKKRYSRI